MTLQLVKHWLIDSGSYLCAVPFAWTTSSPRFTHSNLSSKITSSKKSSWTIPAPVTTTTKVKKNFLLDALQHPLLFITSLNQSSYRWFTSSYLDYNLKDIKMTSVCYVITYSLFTAQRMAYEGWTTQNYLQNEWAYKFIVLINVYRKNG